MAVYNAWTVEYKNGSTWTAISNVQDLSCSVGRQTAVDQWPVSQASIRIWFPTGYSTPIANLTIGTYIRFFAPGRSSTKPSWTGLVQNLTLEVGIPWNSATSTGNGDFLVIDCEGALASFTRSNSVVVAGTGGNLSGLVLEVCTANKIPYGSTTDGLTNLQTFRYDNGAEFTVNPGEILANVSTQSLQRILDGVKRQPAFPPNIYWPDIGATDDPAILFGAITNWGPVGTQVLTSVSFSDTANDTQRRIYDQLTFDGLADTYFTQSELSYANATTSGTITKSSSLNTIRTFVGSITPQNPSNIGSVTTSVAEWWANAFNPADISVSSISATTNGQHTQNLDTLGVTDLELGYLPLYVVPVTLRGQTFYCQIEGVQVTADTNSARFTYYVTPTDTTAWFTLDSGNFGVLDQNRLGIY